ncbi:hypothetical protein [Streptomyces sp. NBC_00859]|uniref:hypothetical protein n=1 Tax=Streptomyces sp. NBC_00859 TaxID=2903682 RepID=UPI00386B728F|nr:hypothetical protein OG584_20500 [Streptomyces sp. NBC_00859]
MAAVGLVAVATLSLSGCGGDSGGAPDSKKPAAEQEGGGKPAAADPKGMGLEMKGANGAVLTIDSVQRYEGGVVTVRGEMRNDGKEALNTNHWTGGNDLALKNGYSSSGASLADLKGKKRYYPLRDTQGNCLCNQFHTVFQPGDKAPVYVQFPAPPEGTTAVDFAMPTFGTAPVTITVAQ